MCASNQQLIQSGKKNRTLGFSLVELITVISVLGILAFGTMRFLTAGTTGFVSTNNRTDMVSTVQTTLLGIVRDVRNSLPRSIRVNTTGSCLEFIPIERGTRYVSAPIGTGSTNIWVVPPPAYSPPTNARVALPSNATSYSLPNPGAISSTIASTALEPNGQMRLNLLSNHSFETASAQERLYFVNQPVSYCVDDGRLWRYEEYGFLAAQPNTGDLPSTLPNRVLVAQSVGPSLPVFAFSSASLERNGYLSVNLSITRDDEQITLDQLIAIRNLP